jgi:Ca2+-binding EF-hand superfamily protein
MHAQSLRILAGLATAALMLVSPGRAYAQTSKLIQNMDVNKDGKISRDEMPEGGAIRRLFDNLVEKYKLDPKKTYTIAEFEQATGTATASTSSSTSSNTSNSNPPSRFGGARRSSGFGPGSSFGSGRGGTPSRTSPSRASEELPEAYRIYDKDGDGQIGLYEWPRDRIREFMALDVNDDGFLTANELRRSNGTGGSREAPKEKKDETKKDETKSDEGTSSSEESAS